MFLNLSRAVENICYDINKNLKEEVHMAKKKDFNVIEIDGTTYTIAERVREESDVRMIPYSVKMYVEEVDNGEICRDPLIQRTDDQWTRKQKSKLIEAALHNRPIGSIALAKGRAESKSYAVTSLLDGLQRTTALVDFYHDKFALDKSAKSVACRGIDKEGNEMKIEIEIANKKYSQLPDAIKVFLDKYRLTTYIHEGFTDEELDDIVFCMNNGKTPNSYQKMRFLLGSENMRKVQPICDSELWNDSKGCKAKNDSILCCVIRIFMMMTHYNYTNLGSSTMTKFADNDFEDYVNDDIILKLSNLVNELAEIKNNLTGEEVEKFDSITIPHYILALDNFNINDKNDKSFIDFLRAFWQSNCYKRFVEECDAKGGGSSLYSSECVEERQYIIYGFIDEYLDIAENDNGDDEDERSTEKRDNPCEEGTKIIDNTDNETENSPDEKPYDVGDVLSVGRNCGQTGGIGYEEQKDTDCLSGREPIITSA